jgi:transposase
VDTSNVQYNQAEEKIMGHKNKRYAEEFKREALEMAAKGDVSVAQLERDLGITPGLIYKWRQRYRVDDAGGELKPRAEREVEAEIRRLKRELAIAREERDILKKAIQVFSQDRTR